MVTFDVNGEERPFPLDIVPRVIAGRYKGRRLKAPTWDGLRPTSDKLRETLFNILAPRIDGARVLRDFGRDFQFALLGAQQDADTVHGQQLGDVITHALEDLFHGLEIGHRLRPFGEDFANFPRFFTGAHTAQFR